MNVSNGERTTTNFCKITHAQTPEELLDLIGTGCFRCVYKDSCGSFSEDCVKGNIAWLYQEVAEQ